MMPMDFDFLRRLLKERSGLALSPEKRYLAESRLMPVARKAGFDTLETLISRLRRKDSEALVTEVVEAMTTRETLFYRDRTPFQLFRETVLPALLAARASRRHIRIWCAACSTGQEAYSLAMALREMDVALRGWRIDILATDLSADALSRAREGAYSQFEVQRGLPILLLIKYFTQEGERWRISPLIRNMVRFQQHNLLDSLTPLGRFDVIFCRNVLIYFDMPTKQDVLQRLAAVAEPDGFLQLGAAETVVGLSDAWRPTPESYALYQPAAGRSSWAGAAERAGRLSVIGKAGG